MLPTNAEKHAILASDVDQDLRAPANCPVCLTRISTVQTKRLADGSMRRYRRCKAGCYSDAVDLIIVRSRIHAPD